MYDIIQALVAKFPCADEASATTTNNQQSLTECDRLKYKYNDRFLLFNQDKEIAGEFTSACSSGIVFTVIGPPLSRNLRYPDMCPFGSTSGVVTYLLNMHPPITLSFQLGPKYPSDRTFKFELQCCWLPPHMIENASESIRGLLKSHYITSPLSHCCRHLDLMIPSLLLGNGDPKRLVLNVFKMYDKPDKQKTLVEILVGFEEEMRDNKFELAEHDCGVCLEKLQGTECIALINCGHVCCKECAQKNFKCNIDDAREGGNPVCPDCNTPVRPHEIKEVVSPELYAQYEKRLLNRTLAAMRDIVECPRPGCPNEHVMLNDNFEEGRCVQCQFHFCARCRSKFHGGDRCREGRIAKLTPDQVQDIVKRYNESGPDGKKLIHLEYGEINIRTMLDDMATQNFLSKEVKQCPNCLSPIQKTGGCNRMLCNFCHINFCWICLAIISDDQPYAHFTMCELWN